jgi:tight adherence protein C
MQLWILIGSVFVVIFLITFVLLVVLRQLKHPAVKRMKELQEDRGSAKGQKSKSLNKRKEDVHDQVEEILSQISRFTRQNPEKLNKIRESLIRAGYYRENSVRIFLGIKILSAVLFFFVFFYFGVLGDRSPSTVALLASLMVFVGYRFPDVILIFKVRTRQEKIARALPDALDLLVISVEAGLGLNAAILRVGGDLAVRCPPLADEFNRVNQDLRTGVAREKALRNLCNRNQIEDLRIFVGALILADRLGTSIADTLRSQADSLRTRIRQKAEEQAARSGIKLLFPLVLFILPALIMILMGPGLISVFRTFSH